MHRNLISYSFFSRKRKEPGRWYDPIESQDDRYWVNIPAMLIANSAFYPEYKTKIFIDPGIHNHELFPLLDNLDRQGIIELSTCNYWYSNTEATFWRLQPLWEDFNLLFCRDIDSVPTSREAQCTLAFAQSSYLVHNIRTHPHHNGYLTRMLAGLCGFRNGVKSIVPGSFDDYYKLAGPQWGTDQGALMQYFVERPGNSWTSQHFLDSTIDALGPMCDIIDGFEACHFSKEHYASIDLSHVPTEIREACDALTQWPGQPVDARGDITRKLINQPFETAKLVKTVVENWPPAKNFYQCS